MTNAHYSRTTDADGIVTLTLDDPTGSANVMNEHYQESMHNAVERLVAEKDSITGVVIAAMLGGDLSTADVWVREVLGPLASSEAVEKIVHDLGFDARLLADVYLATDGRSRKARSERAHV